uniref:Photosystem I assembly protein Ycf4 n=1 Tax=Glaucocystis incrassata TaxID=1789788 RepID=A0A3G1IVC3_9EUKA|nr:photosystem I assembly protein Ycf4 [Glaucocystis incrassata]ASQ39995.1 photosystem I assembly protein Ycf4 [Glaucocystis incrassata]
MKQLYNSMLNGNVRIDLVAGTRRLSNYIFCLFLLGMGIGFLYVSLTIVLNLSNHNPELRPIPHGLALGFYGAVQFILSYALAQNIYFNVGQGINIYNKSLGTILLLRLNYPGNARITCSKVNVKDVIGVGCGDIKSTLNTDTTIYLRINGTTNKWDEFIEEQRDVPITPKGYTLSSFELEKKVTDLANFLNVPIILP